MGQVIGINQKRFFTLDEARVILPIVRRITRHSFGEVKQRSLQLTLLKDRSRKRAVEKEIQIQFEDWHRKIQKLGCEAKGMWLVDFDSGDGYYCWHYPEPDISFFHGYFDGFRGRTPIQ